MNYFIRSLPSLFIPFGALYAAYYFELFVLMGLPKLWKIEFLSILIFSTWFFFMLKESPKRQT